MEESRDCGKDGELKDFNSLVQLPNSGRLLTTFPIQPGVLSKLSKAGYVTTSNIFSLRPSELSSGKKTFSVVHFNYSKNQLKLEGAEITIEDAADVLEIVSNSTEKLFIKSALDMLYEDLKFCKIVTMSAKLDEILNGGITIGKVTEIAGVAGVGKTQFWYENIKKSHLFFI